MTMMERGVGDPVAITPTKNTALQLETSHAPHAEGTASSEMRTREMAMRAQMQAKAKNETGNKMSSLDWKVEGVEEQRCDGTKSLKSILEYQISVLSMTKT